jgi:hypothetical protein
MDNYSDKPLHLDEEKFEGWDPQEKEFVLVQRAGLDAVNGVDKRVGTFDGVGNYSMIRAWQGHNHDLYHCNV